MNTTRGIIFNLSSVVSFSLMGALVKYLIERYPTGEVVFVRSFFAIIPIMVMLFLRNSFPSGIYTKHPRKHVVRVIISIIGMFTGFAAMNYLSLADITAIGFSSPFLTILLSIMFLNEKVDRARWIAVLVGLAGVLIILYPHLTEARQEMGHVAILGITLALVWAFSVAFATVAVRTMTQTETTTSIVFYFSVGTSLAALLTLPLGWKLPTLIDGGAMIASGILGGLGQIFLTQSYRHAEPSFLAPFGYTSIIFAMLFDLFLFSAAPTLYMLVGSIVVILMGIYVVMAERKKQLIVLREEEMVAEELK